MQARPQRGIKGLGLGSTGSSGQKHADHGSESGSLHLGPLHQISMKTMICAETATLPQPEIKPIPDEKASALMLRPRRRRRDFAIVRGWGKLPLC
jgi:hypothetical protein